MFSPNSPLPVFEQEPVQRIRSQVQGRLLHKALHLLEPTSCHNVWATQHCESFRDLVVALGAHQPKCYHLGMGTKFVTKTTLTRTNRDKDHRIFEDFAFHMMDQVRKKQVDHIFKLIGNVYMFDSTIIPLRPSVFLVGQIPKAERRCESPFPLRPGNFGTDVLPHLEGLGARLQNNVRGSLRIRLVLRVRSRLQCFCGTLQDSQEELLLLHEGKEEPLVQAHEMAVLTSEEYSHGC